eukprot:1178196-Prorocentrum_minimum.AAC.2
MVFSGETQLEAIVGYQGTMELLQRYVIKLCWADDFQPLHVTRISSRRPRAWSKECCGARTFSNSQSNFDQFEFRLLVPLVKSEYGLAEEGNLQARAAGEKLKEELSKEGPPLPPRTTALTQTECLYYCFINPEGTRLMLVEQAGSTNFQI